MKALADRVGWGPLTLFLAAAATFWTLGDWRGWLPAPAGWAGLYRLAFWITAWSIALQAWHGWTVKAWKPSEDMLGIDRGCWATAVAHLLLAEALRDGEAPGWAFIHACAALLLLAGVDAQRPRPVRDKLGRASVLLFLLAACCWPAMGIALGTAAEDLGSGAFLGVLATMLALCGFGSVAAILTATGGRSPKTQSDSLVADLGLLAAAGLPPWVRAEKPHAEPTPLGSYQFESQAFGDGERRRLMAAVKAEAAPPERVSRPMLVDSGGFRVDPEKAIEKLSKFRSADPGDFILALFRAAVAAKAEHVRVERMDSGLRLRFDGRPLEPAAVADPLGMLVTSGLDGPERELATGILGALALPNCRMTIVSGSGGKRRWLRISPKGDGTPVALKDSPEPSAPGAAADLGADTVIETRWWGHREDVLKAFQRRVGMAGTCWSIDGKEQSKDPPTSAAVEWWSPAKRDRLLMGPRRDLEGASRLRFYKLGTLVGEEVVALASAPIEACVRDDAFILDVSQTKVVHDARHKAAVQAAADAAESFKRWLANEHKQRWPKLRAPKGFPLLPYGVWHSLRSWCGFPAPAVVARDAWDRNVRQWLEANP